MQHKVKLTVIDKKFYPELQLEYCDDPESGECPCYNIGDEFIFERYKQSDDFWHMGLNTLKQTVHKASEIAGSDTFPHCSEAWDAISRYIYTGLQGGSIMRGWMRDERVMIACCSDGTRPVIFKIERMDYKVIYLDDKINNEALVKTELEKIEDIADVIFCDDFIEVYVDNDVNNQILIDKLENCGNYDVIKID